VRLLLFLGVLCFFSCKKEDTPRVMIIESITIKKAAVTKANGGSWDVVPNSGADVFLVIRDNRGTLFKQSDYFPNCTATTVFEPIVLSPALRVSDYKADLIFEYWDDDGLSDELMGGLVGSPYADNKPVISTVSTPDGQYVLELNLSYEY
jgi:hypothetical protein